MLIWSKPSSDFSGRAIFFSLQSEEESNIKNYESIDEIKISSLIPEKYDKIKVYSHIKVNIVFSNEKNKRWIFRIEDREHLKFINFLRKEKLITEEPIIEQIPITIYKEELVSISKVQMGIGKLKLNDQYVIGKPFSIFMQAFGKVFGIMMILSGALLFLSAINLLITNIRVFRKTGEFPELWNSIDTRIEAWKYILGGFKSKNEKDHKE